MSALWSLNEIEALARKAARGGGYDWGVAEEAGLAVRWLAARDLPGAEALLKVCDAGAGETPELCPLRVGCAFADGVLPPSDVTGNDLVAPLLLLPFVAWTAERLKTDLRLAWSDAEFFVGREGDLHWNRAVLAHEMAVVSLSEGSDQACASVSPGFRASVDCETYVRLSEYAGRTYAPSSEASRASGAGAGLTDND